RSPPSGSNSAHRCATSISMLLRRQATSMSASSQHNRIPRASSASTSSSQRSLWLADAYFVGIAPYVQALVAAARDGVDVRLMVPGASDLPVVAAISQ